MKNKSRRCDLTFPRLVGHVAFQRYTNPFIHYSIFDQLWIQQSYHIMEYFLSKLLKALTQSEYLVKNSFEAVEKINKILVDPFVQGY